MTTTAAASSGDSHHSHTPLVSPTSVLLLLLCLLLLPMLTDTPATSADAPAPVIPLPAGVLPNQIVVSPDGSHVAFVVPGEAGRHAVMLDGKPFAEPATVRTPWMAPGPSCMPDIYAGLFFSPNGERLAYAAADGKQWRMVIDGKPGTAYDDVDLPVFSADSRQVAYAAKAGNKWHVVVDGREEQPFDYIGTGGGMGGDPNSIRPIFTPDSQHLIYVGRNQENPLLAELTAYPVIDGKVGPAYGAILRLVLSETGGHYAFVAEKGRQHVVVIDGKEGAPVEYIREIVISPDGQHVAYAEQREKFWYLIADGRERTGSLQVSQLRYSADSKRLAGVIKGKEGQDILWLDGEVAGESLEHIYGITFSPDSRRVAFIRDFAHKVQRVAMDGAVQAYDSTGWPPVFSPDSRRVAYTARVEGKAAAVVDGKLLPAIDGWIHEVRFTPDNRHAVYTFNTLGAKDVPIMGVGVDDRQETFTGYLLPAGGRYTYFYFDAPDHFHYFRVKDKAVERVEVKLPPADAAAGRGTPTWVDRTTGKTLFTAADLVRFDWEKQLFELQREKAMDLMARRHRLISEFEVKDGEGVIYRGAFCSGVSSQGFDGPAILADFTPDVPPPIYRIQQGYPGAYKGSPDLRFNTRLKAALAQAGKLAAIPDTAKVTPIKTIGTEWRGKEQGNCPVQVRAVIFPETFRLGEKARVHIFFAADEKYIPADNDIVDIGVTLSANGGRFGCHTQSFMISLKTLLEDGVYIYKGMMWGPVISSIDPYAKPGPAELTVEVIHHKGWETIKLPAQKVEILPKAP